MKICNPITLKWINAYISSPKTSLLINCPLDLEMGINIARHIHISLAPKQVPLYTLDILGKNSLGIDEIRELQKYLSLKADLNGKYTRFVMVPEAERLSIEAQNSLLKILEELPERTIIFLVTTKESSVIPTIHSRCFKINVLPILRSQSIYYGKELNIDTELINRAYSMSEGYVSNFIKLLQELDGNTSELMETSKHFITSSVYNRQLILRNIFSDKTDINEFLQSLLLIIRASMRNAKSVNDKYKWKKILVSTLLVQEQIDANVQPKLALLSLSMSM